MRKSFRVPAFLVVFAFVSPAKTPEETPKAELYAGYDYVRLTSSGTAFNFIGGSGQLAYNVNDWLGVAGDLGGYYTNNGFHAGILSYQFGPRINLRGHGRVTPFAQALFGGARSIDISPENTFAMTVGGGVDFKISEHFALVTGATGRQGGAVIRHMLPKGWKVRALTRNPSNHAAQDLARKGAEVVHGDLEDPPSIARAAVGVYSVQDFWAVGAKREVQQGKNLADAAKRAGVKHFVYSSVGGAERNTGIPHWESKWEVEKHIRSLGLLPL